MRFVWHVQGGTCGTHRDSNHGCRVKRGLFLGAKSDILHSMGSEQTATTCRDCRRRGWGNAEPVVWVSPEGTGYCVFHAPADQKRRANANGGLLTTHEFNELIHARVRDSATNRTPCNLSGTVFPGDIVFTGSADTNTLPPMRMDHCEFHGRLTFRQCVFDGMVLFVWALFKARANFERVRFLGPAFFNCAGFEDQLRLDRVDFCDLGDLRGARAMTNGAKLRLLGLSTKSLGNLVFIGDRVPMLEYRHARWPAQLGLEVRGRRISQPLHAFSELHLIECEELYRAMKQRARDDGDSFMASHWHVREKDFSLQRLRRRSPVLSRLSLLNLYRLASGYGEQPLRAGLVLALLVLLPLPLLLLMQLSAPPSSAQILQVLSPEVFSNVLGDWLRCMPLVKIDAGQPAALLNAARGWLAWFSQAAIGLQAALFALAVRNRLRR